MKRILFTLLIFTLVLVNNDCFGQLDFQKEGFTIRGAFTNFEFADSHKEPFQNLYPGIELGYVRKIKNYTYFNLPLRFSLVDLPADKNGIARRDEILTNLGINFQIMNDNKAGRWLQPYAYLGFDVLINDNINTNFGIPVGAGLNIRVGSGWHLNWQTGFRGDISNKDLSSLEHRFGFVVGLGDVPEAPKIPDTDMDGINDAQDQCPTIPGVAEFAGCPDTDGDGLSDKIDGCPEEAGSAELNGCPDSDGDKVVDKEDDCPEIAGVLELKGCPDTDGDGIGDADDKCPNEAGSAETQGCPDRDNDGVLDEDDQCPDAPGAPALKGCPDTDGDGTIDKNDKCPNDAGASTLGGCPDDDGDGISNIEDKCPTQAGPRKNNGCPELTEEEKEVLTFAAQAIQFETGSSSIKSSSFEILNNVAGILKKYPDYKCDISGHTDSIGNTTNNQTLSEERAKACFDYLISKGIPAKNLTHKGYGETKPIADNRYKSGRNKNRRVEFDIHP